MALALGISRGSVYYLPRPVAATDLVVMRPDRRTAPTQNFPFARQPDAARDLLAGEGFAVEAPVVHVA